VGNQPEWKVERQPAWLVAAIRKTIAELPGGYAEAAEIIDTSQDALFNRLRTGGDQIFPLAGRWCFKRLLASAMWLMHFHGRQITGFTSLALM
jgi:hypothetical protein